MAKVVQKIGAVVEGRLISLTMEIVDELEKLNKTGEDNSAEIIDALGAYLFSKTNKFYTEEIVDRLATGALDGDW